MSLSCLNVLLDYEPTARELNLYIKDKKEYQGLEFYSVEISSANAFSGNYIEFKTNIIYDINDLYDIYSQVKKLHINPNLK